MVPESNVTSSELFSAFALFVAAVGVFAHPKEEEEGNVGEVADGLGFGRAAVATLDGCVFGDGDWDS